jgi:RNA polymerase primary sigma factor
VQYIARYIQAKSPLIVIPQRKEELIRHVQSARDYLFQQEGHDPQACEIAEYLDLPQKVIKGAMRYAYSITSLDSDIDSCQGQTMTDMIPDVKFAPETYISRMSRDLEINALLKSLPPVEYKVIYHRYNFEGAEKKKTLREIGGMLGISAETVRQTELRAIKRLKKICAEKGYEQDGLIA